MIIVCKKDLYKSTYNKNAFSLGKSYEVINNDNDFYYVLDNNGKEFNFSIKDELPYYFLSEYFL